MACVILKSELDRKRQDRRTMNSCVSKSGDVAILRWQATAWCDSMVNAISTFVGNGNVYNVKRWSKVKKNILRWNGLKQSKRIMKIWEVLISQIH